MPKVPEVLVTTPFFYYPGLAEKCPPRFDPLGGMHLLIYGLVTSLSELGIISRVVNMGIPWAKADMIYDNGIAVHARRYWVPPIPSRLEGYFGLVAAWGLATVQWVGKEKHRLQHIKLVHCHLDGSGFAAWTGRKCAEILNVPLVMSIHSCRSLTQHPTTWIEHIADPWSKRQEQMAIARADAVFTLTQAVKDGLAKELKVPPQKVEVLVFQTTRDFPSHDTEDRRQELRRLLNLNPDEPIVLYVGRIAAEKGVEFLIEALPFLKERQRCRVIICGDGPMRAEIEKLIRKLRVQDICTITGFLKPELIPSLISLSTIGVLPSRYEELGLVILEFLSMGRPLVVHDVPNVRAMLTPEKTATLVTPFQPEALSDGILRLLRDKRLHDEMSGN